MLFRSVDAESRGSFPGPVCLFGCGRKLEINDERFLVPGLQAVICEDCDHRNASGILAEVVELIQWILKNALEPYPGSAGAGGTGFKKPE